MSRRAVSFIALSVAIAGCAQQAPERSSLPAIPAELSFVTTSAGAVTTAAPQAATTSAPVACELAAAAGASVLRTAAGSAAADRLVPGDRITAVDDERVGSAESLVAILTARRPGDTVTITFSRDDVEQSADITLGTNSEDETRPRLGVEVNTVISPYLIDELPPDLPLGNDVVIAEVDNTLFLLEPAAPSWRATPTAGVRGSNVVLYDGQAFAANAGPELISLGGSEPLALPVGGKSVIQVLGVSTGRLLVSTAGLADGAVTDPEILAIDVAAMTVAWRLRLPDFEGQPVTARWGWVSTDGSRIAVTSLSGDTRLHTLVGDRGEILAGWGSPNEPFIRSDAILGGWTDASRLSYIFRDTTSLALGIHETEGAGASEPDTLVRLPAVTEAVLQLWTVPATDTAVLSTETGTDLISLIDGSLVHPLSAGCVAMVVSATAG